MQVVAGERRAPDARGKHEEEPPPKRKKYEEKGPTKLAETRPTLCEVRR